MKIYLILGSRSDLEWAEIIRRELAEFGLEVTQHIASAHRQTDHLLNLVAAIQPPAVVITVAGLNDALSGIVCAHTTVPVVACPPRGASTPADWLSFLHSPAGVAPALFLRPRNAALFVAKLIGLHDTDMRSRVLAVQHAYDPARNQSAS